MKAYYFPKLPLHVITLSSLPSHPEYLKDENINVKFNDWKQTYNEDILESISSKTVTGVVKFKTIPALHPQFSI